MASITVSREDDLLMVEFDRSDRANALSQDMVEELLDLLQGSLGSGVRLAVFRGNGANFCAGFDLGDLELASDAALLWRMVRLEFLLQSIAHAPFMTMALAHGNAIGAGADIFAACGIRIAAPGTKFRMPGWRFGIALGTRRFAARAGPEVAREILMSGRSFAAEHGLKIGFVESVLPVDEWPAAIRQKHTHSRSLGPVETARLLFLTTPDTRDGDLAALMHSACRPGLKDRIRAFRETINRKG